MKTTRSNDFRRRPSEWPRVLIVIFCCFVLIFGGSFFNATFGRMALALSSPFLHLGNAVTMTLYQADSALRSKQALVAANQTLKEQLLALDARQTDYQILAGDNEALRQEIGLSRPKSKMIIAEVLSQPWGAPFDIIEAALPADNQVTLGDTVTFQEKVLAGTVINRAAGMAQIQLLSAPRSTLPVSIGVNKVPALATGKGSGNLELALPRNVAISVGDLVVTASSSAPLVVGKVGAVDQDPSESLQTILIRTPIDLSAVRYLEIHER